MNIKKDAAYNPLAAHSNRALGETISLRSMAEHIESLNGGPKTSAEASFELDPDLSGLDQMILALVAIKNGFSGKIEIKMKLHAG
ncbi:MAG: hypothetical protein AAFR51_14035 [Pseudomonadota bacterium]